MTYEHETPFSVTRNLQDLIPRLRELGWNVWPDNEPDFIPWGDDDLLPIAEAGSLALKQAMRGWEIPPPPRRPWRDSSAPSAGS